MSRRGSRRRWAIARCTASRASRCSWRAWRKTSRSFATKPRRSRRSRRSRSWSPGVSRRAAVEATCRSRLLSATSGRCATGRPSESRPACEPEPARSGCKTGAQLAGAQTGDVDRAPRLVLPPALSEGASVNGVEADLIDQLGDGPLRALVIPGDRDADALRVTRRTAVVAQLIPPDGVERLDHAGSRQMRLKQLAGGYAVAVELVEMAVSLRVVERRPLRRARQRPH